MKPWLGAWSNITHHLGSNVLYHIKHTLPPSAHLHKNSPTFKLWHPGNKSRGRRGQRMMWDSLICFQHTADTHLQHRGQQSELCQQTQCWWDAGPHQHWRGLCTLCSTLWTRRTEMCCCEDDNNKKKKQISVWNQWLVQIYIDKAAGPRCCPAPRSRESSSYSGG